MSSTISREETEILTREEKLLQISTQPKLAYLLPTWEWTPSRAMHETNVYRMANTIVKEAQTSFQQIGFMDTMLELMEDNKMVSPSWHGIIVKILYNYKCMNMFG